MGILNNTSESFVLTTKDMVQSIDISMWLDFGDASYARRLQRNKLHYELVKRLEKEIMAIQSPAPTSIQLRKVIRNVLGCKVSVRKKPAIFKKGKRLAYFYDITVTDDGSGITIPETIINSCALGIDDKVILRSINTITILFKQTAPYDGYKF